MQPFTSQPEVVRPRRQMQPPAYLQDYDLRVGQRCTSQPVDLNTAQYAQGTEEGQPHRIEEGVKMVTPRSSRASSPLSQWDTLDVLTFEERLSFSSKQGIDPQHHVVALKFHSYSLATFHSLLLTTGYRKGISSSYHR